MAAYEIRVTGPVGPLIAAAFDDVTIRSETVIETTCADQAALHGLLARIRDLGLDLVEVRTVPAAPEW